MISPQKVALIRRLLQNQCLSLRKIAEKVGVSRSTVRSLAEGTRPEYALQPPRRWREFQMPEETPYQRCPECGAWVQLPCHACAVRRMREHECLPVPPALAEESLKLELHPKHRKRYRRVRVRRTIQQLHRQFLEEES